MVRQTLSEKYIVKNLDCASCAAKIEKGLQQAEGVTDAVIDFANLTLHVTAVDMQPVLDTVRRIDPQIELVAHADSLNQRDQDLADDGLNLKKELTLLIVATILFSWQLYFENQSVQNPLAQWEIAWVLAAYFLVGWNVVAGAARTIKGGMFFDENVLMVIATGGAIAIATGKQNYQCLGIRRYQRFMQHVTHCDVATRRILAAGDRTQRGSRNTIFRTSLRRYAGIQLAIARLIQTNGIRQRQAAGHDTTGLLS